MSSPCLDLPPRALSQTTRILPAIGLLALAFAPAALAQAAAPQNFVILLADDLGVDQLASYGEGSDPPPTPWLDVIAASGVRFTNAYANPSCSPTRAQIQTGRHGFRTGIGFITHGGGPELPLTEILLPEALGQYAPHQYSSAVLGKWHLTNGMNNGPAHPLLQGYDHHSGSMAGFDQGNQNYYAHVKFTDGIAGFSTKYATTETVDDALAWVETAQEPWLLFVSFNAPHAPFDYPPPSLHTQWTPPGATQAEIEHSKYKAMVQAMDLEIGRLITSIPIPQLLHTLFVFTGDNGSPEEAVVPPFDPNHAKLSLHEGGCNVPLIIGHAFLPEKGKTCDALVQLTDIFPTILELAGVNPTLYSAVSGKKLDGRSLLPFFKQVSAPALHQVAFSELFQPNGFAPVVNSYGVRDERYRLVIDGFSGSTKLFDLWTDPFEKINLLGGPMGSAVQNALQILQSELAAILSS